jgi:hypothetical protein
MSKRAFKQGLIYGLLYFVAVNISGIVLLPGEKQRSKPAQVSGEALS